MARRTTLPGRQKVLSPEAALAVLQQVRHALDEAPPALRLSAISSEDTLVGQIQAGVEQILLAGQCQEEVSHSLLFSSCHHDMDPT
jgi:hypothetical protein